MNAISKIALLAAAFSSLASAQFSFIVTQAGRSNPVSNTGNITFTSRIGQIQLAHVVATYTGKGRITIPGQPNVVGAQAFSSANFPNTPLTLQAGKTFEFDIQFLPTSAIQATGQYNLGYNEILPDAGSGLDVSTFGIVQFNLSGSAPSLVIAYAILPDANTVTLPAGGAVTFPPTALDATGVANLIFTNNGSGQGLITGITISGQAFRLTNLPLLPYTVAPSTNVSVQIQYKPTGVGTDTGYVNVTFQGEPAVTINLQGTGSSSQFSFQVIQSDSQVPVAPGGTISFPQTRLGQTNSVVFKITNGGNASGAISSISATGAAYTLTGLPALPLTLGPNGAATFTATFTPTQPGTALGNLLINNNSFTLSGVGLASQITVSYDVSGSTVTLSQSNSSIVFRPVKITESTSFTMRVKNTGTLDAVLANIGVGQNNSPFSVTGLPALPVSLAPNAEFQFTLAFAPATLGFTNGTLILDSTTINLVGSGTEPPPLPAYTIGGVSGTAQPLTQPSITLTLANPYPVALSGNLTLSTSGTMPADPSVQFASGGLTVPFTVAANSTSATFGNFGSRIGLQTGTVANTITLTPTFSTRVGAVDLTPATPTTLQFSVAGGGPAVLFAQATPSGLTPGAASSTVTISLTGYATSRTLNSVTIEFTPASGFSMPTSRFTLDVRQLAASWFRSAASTPFGGQFNLTVPFTFQAPLASSGTIISPIASVSVAATNDGGTSSAVQVPVQ